MACGTAWATWEHADDRGRVWFCGRKSQRVVTPERTYYTISCEGVFKVHKGVYRTAPVGVRGNGATEPVLCVEPEKDVQGPRGRRCGRSCWRSGRPGRTRRRFKRSSFTRISRWDVRHNAKIFREKLAAWAGKELS